MTDDLLAAERPELDCLRKAGGELGASFLPITKDQATVVRATLLGSTDRCRELRTGERS